MAASPPPSGAVSHLVGPVIRVDAIHRQRCMWCGALVDEIDASRTAVGIPEGKTAEQARADGDLDLPSWQLGAWVAVDGHARWVVRTAEEDQDAADAPEGSCCHLDPEVTR